MTDTNLTGGCQCGRVRYAFSGAPVDVTVCHCRMCQMAVGGPFITLVQLRPGQIAWTKLYEGDERAADGLLAHAAMAHCDFDRRAGHSAPGRTGSHQ